MRGKKNTVPPKKVVFFISNYLEPRKHAYFLSQLASQQAVLSAYDPDIYSPTLAAELIEHLSRIQNEITPALQEISSRNRIHNDYKLKTIGTYYDLRKIKKTPTRQGPFFIFPSFI